MHGERLRRRAFSLAWLSQLAELVLGIDERSQLVGDLGTLGEERIAIDCVAAIDALQVLLEGNLQLIVGRLGPDGRALRPIRFCRPRVVDRWTHLRSLFLGHFDHTHVVDQWSCEGIAFIQGV